jgi:hypothetical protein
MSLLRLRPKPPEGLPTINAGKPWSEDDLADLQVLLIERRSVREIAEYLCREVLEVESKIEERRGSAASTRTTRTVGRTNL